MSVLEEIIAQLKSQGSEANREGMHRFGITLENTLGVPLPYLRNMAKSYRNNHALALQLWETGIHEARMLATMIDNPADVTEEQMEHWVHDFNSWDICDQCCCNFFDKSPYALQKIEEWVERDEEYVKRAGFVLMAVLAVHDKGMEDKVFISFLPIILKHAGDNRNFVRKAVNWALRQIGKRNQVLYDAALQFSKELMLSENKNAKWIASDAYRELMGQTAINRMKRSQENADKRNKIKQKKINNTNT